MLDYDKKSDSDLVFEFNTILKRESEIGGITNDIDQIPMPEELDSELERRCLITTYDLRDMMGTMAWSWSKSALKLLLVSLTLDDIVFCDDE